MRQNWCAFYFGPLNGGLPWPKGYGDIRRKEKEWLGYVRDLYKILPGYRSTRKNAKAIMIASGATWDQMPKEHHHKCIYIPENGIEAERFAIPVEHTHSLPLKVAFTGRLVPYKGADMVLEAAAPLIKEGKVVLDIIGDGSEMPRLKEFVAREKLEAGVKLAGWVEHTQVHKRLSQSDVFAFPSIREFGGAVVIEAMALGLVPIVVNYGGPAESVTSSTGYTVPIGTRAEIIEALRKVLQELVANPDKTQRHECNAPRNTQRIISPGRRKLGRFWKYTAGWQVNVPTNRTSACRSLISMNLVGRTGQPTRIISHWRQRNNRRAQCNWND